MAMENNNHDQINSVSSTNIGDGDSSEKSHLNPVANDNNGEITETFFERNLFCFCYST